MARLSKRKRCAKINGKAGGRPRKIIAVETTLPVDDSDGNVHNVMEECVDVDDEDLTIANDIRVRLPMPWFYEWH